MAGDMSGRMGMCGRGGVHGGGMCDRGCAWQGGMCGREDVHGQGGCAWQGGHYGHYEIRSVNARAVGILLECILVGNDF